MRAIQAQTCGIAESADKGCPQAVHAGRALKETRQDLDNPIPKRIQLTSRAFKNLNCDCREIQLPVVSP